MKTQNPSHIDPDQSIITKLYAALGAALVLSFVPHFAVTALAATLFIGVLIAAYIYRGRTQTGSLLDNHTTYLIRTIWIGSLVSVIFTVIAAFYMLPQVDSTPMLTCMENIITGVPDIESALQPCFDEYMRVNYPLFIRAGAIAIIPTVLYFILRYARGVMRATRGYRIDNENKWL